MKLLRNMLYNRRFLLDVLNKKNSFNFGSYNIQRLHTRKFNVDSSQLSQILSTGKICLIDVRNEDEYAQGNILGSLHIPLPKLKETFELPENEFLEKYNIKKPTRDDDNIILHCRAGSRSLDGLKIMHELGYKRSKHLEGGFNEWINFKSTPVKNENCAMDSQK